MAKKSKQRAQSNKAKKAASASIQPPSWEVSADHRSVALTLPGNPPAKLMLDAAGVEDLLAALGQIRLGLSPEVPRGLVDGQTINVFPNPFWIMAPARTAGDAMLHLRDPRYGWLHYQIPKSESSKLLQFLQTLIG